jgi:hypothetical protein
MAGSPHAALRETLTKVRARIAELRANSDHLSEEETKAILIDPVLAALGWHVDELEDVRREYRAKPSDNPVDYALFVFGKPRLFIEAKALTTALDRKSASQVLGYAATVGVGWCVLANGDEYRLYKSHANVDVDEKLLRTVRLSDPDQAGLCLETLALIAREQMGDTELELLWKSQFVDRRVKTTLEELFAEENGALARLVHKHSGELSLGDVKESLQRAQLQVHFPAVAAPATAVGHPAPGSESKPPNAPHSPPVELHDLIDGGLVQAPLSLEKTYKGVALEAVVEVDGRVRFAEESYDSLSTAGGMARKSVIGAPEGREYPQTNGWTFWQYRDLETGDLRPIDDLRQRYLQSKA